MTRKTVAAAETGHRARAGYPPAKLNPGRLRTASGRSHLRADTPARA